MNEKHKIEKVFTTSEDSSERRIRKSIENDANDAKFGFNRHKDVIERTGFLVNMHTTEIIDENKRLKSAVDYYFIEEDGTRFKVSFSFQPYFYIVTKKDTTQEVSNFLMKKYDGVLDNIKVVTKEDLNLPNHLIGLKQRFLKLSFCSVAELLKVRRDIIAAVRKYKETSKNTAMYNKMFATGVMNMDTEESSTKKHVDQFENIIDIREYDVPYHIRVSIDNKIFVGCWYTVKLRHANADPVITRRTDIIETPDVIVLAFDIECTKQPLKFPDPEFDQIIMISYMIDGQGYLINNRDFMSQDVDDFEYTPSPEFEGCFIVYNEPNELALLRRFFDHILDVKPHVIVTYNGDNFDWPFVEKRASFHKLSILDELGFSKGKDSAYLSRPIVHMDCLCWVKRDSYLPVGSQNLKAVAKAKLRYDPVELDPEEMCRLAAEEPQALANYSVSDAVATYYLYMKYVHPFIFALCTIIPMEPDEVLRKGSGTLCETLLMVEAFHANIIYPNKQVSEVNKVTPDGHVIDTETYVGGHVEALESGVFRADIPCRFKLVPEAFDKLIEDVEKVIKHAIENEEKIPMSSVTNLEDVTSTIVDKLKNLKDNPVRMEKPVIYHLDVGAMYPNIILTNRLQPYAVVNEETCAVCDFNRPNATCQRRMTWMWRGEIMPATRSEFHRIQQQLETEKFPPEQPGGAPRAFHQLTKDEQVTYEKKRLNEYCRRVYKKIHVTKMGEKETTVCQKENSFYVDTVRAFRDRRYEYKGLCKRAKKEVSEAVAKGDVEEIKSAKNREVLYDSLQLAHKCILNSFYGYVMRGGARWYSMEMAGIVCHTGAAIITRAREIIENVGRPLELDTDGIWCILPGSFPENFDILTTDEKKKKITISYPNAVLNCMVQDSFTNHAYHDLVDPDKLKYVQRSENSIFFEVDGPYLAMVLPASKEEGKKLKKRYAVFNFDKSLAELKGFEVKRRGELQLIKIFQSSVFEAFLKGDTLEKCYESVAKVANYWLDVLYTKAYSLPDSELFDLISENRSMSKKLADYGAQKSTSISTAKRLSEFLGDQVVKDKGLACRFVISRKPEGSPVTERAIPLAIFQADPIIKRHFLRKWLKDDSIFDIDIRYILDWNYYIERLSGAIQKIITIPAALQGLNNPVPRVRHPEWLHKRLLEKNDVLKQRKISEFFNKCEQISEEPQKQVAEPTDIEDILPNASKSVASIANRPVCNKRKRTRSSEFDEEQLKLDWRVVLGPPPSLGTTKEEREAWIRYHKKKWELQRQQRNFRAGNKKGRRNNEATTTTVVRSSNTMGGFLKRSQRSILESDWQVIQVVETNEPGLFKVWALVERELHMIKLNVPRIFYVNQRTPKAEDENSRFWRKVNRILPRSRPVFNLYEYSVPESLYRKHGRELMADLSGPHVDGIYETQVPLDFRVLLTLESVWAVQRSVAHKLSREGMKDTDSFQLDQLTSSFTKRRDYLENLPDGSFPLKTIYLYHHRSSNSEKAFFGLFLTPLKKTAIFVLDTVSTNQMPNLHKLYEQRKNARMEKGIEEGDLPSLDMSFEVHVMTDKKAIYKSIQKLLQGYKDEKKGPTLLLVQSFVGTQTLVDQMPILGDFPIVTMHDKDKESLFAELQWQTTISKYMVERYLESKTVLRYTLDQCRYIRIPIGNLPADAAIFAADLFYGRCLLKNNFVLWCSPTELPDLGGREYDDGLLLTDIDETATPTMNNPGCYSSVVIEIDIDSLAVNTLMQSHRVNEAEGVSSSITFDAVPQASLEEMLRGRTSFLTSYDEAAACSPAFKVIRAMVNSWLRDVSVRRNVCADFLVVHFYRWLRSTNSLLYDPALRRTLLTQMKKLFFLLIAEFKRLGAVIVFANFNKIIICTKKNSSEDAQGYARFLVATIRNKEMFHSIYMGIARSWDYLMWLDIGNYAGVKEKSEAEDTNEYEDLTETESSVGNGEEDNFTVVLNWVLCKYLPKVVSMEKTFNAIITNYVTAIWAEIRSHARGPKTPDKRFTLGSQSQAPPTPLGVGADDSVKEFAKNLIKTDLSPMLFAYIQKVQRTAVKPSDLGDSSVRPKKKFNPALEFINTICKVLSLDNAVTEEVSQLKRNLLKLIEVGEFSESATWTDPCVTTILPEIICTTCNHCRDIDLCKDPNSIVVEGQSYWFCSVCKSNYDNRILEQLLLDTIQRKSMAYTLQDLKCTKCGEIKADNLRDFCSCGGNLKTLTTQKGIAEHLKMLQRIAREFSMSLLQETVEWMLKMNPSFNG